METRRASLLAITIMASIALPAGAADVQQVVIVSKTHFDIGYTERKDVVIDHYRTSMIDKALDVIDETASLPPEFRFAWTLPGWPLAQILWPDQTPERRERILNAMRDGRIVWHALPFTTHTESLEIEDLVRGLGYSSLLSRMMGREPPTDAKMTDVPCHSWILPTLLTRAGIKFLHIGCNGASSGPRVPPLFWWEGPDGSRLLTFYSSGAYGTDLIPPADWPHKTWLAMLMTGDNQGPPSLEDAKRLQKEAAEKLPGVKAHFGRLSDFADALLAENPDLPVVRGDMPDPWIHGIGSMPVETALARRWRPRIGAIEALDTLLSVWGVPGQSATETVKSAYENSLLYGEHTWGSNGTKPGPFRYGEEWKKALQEGVYDNFNLTHEDHRDYARNIVSAVEPAMRERMERLALAVSVSGPRIVVFNPLPWMRNDVVEWVQKDFTASGLRDVAGGEIVPVAHDGDLRRFLASDVPPLGYKTYVPAESANESKDLQIHDAGSVIENISFRITLDLERGGIRSLVRKGESGDSEMVNQSSPYALGQYLYERFDIATVKAFVDAYVTRPSEQWAWNDFGKPGMPDEPYLSASPRKWKLEMHKDAISVRAVMRSEADEEVPDPVTLEVVLYSEQPYVDIAWSIQNKTPDPRPEAGWLCLPINKENPKFRLSRIGAVIDPVSDIVPGSNRHLFCLNSGMAIDSEADTDTVALCPLDSPLVSLAEPGLWKYSLDYVPKTADVFINLFNNQWTTNFPLWVGGSWTSSVRIWAYSRTIEGERLQPPSWEARQGCWASFADGPGGSLPPSRKGLDVGRGGALVTAFGSNPDGPGRILRLWSPVFDKFAIELPEGLNAEGAQLVDLRGRPLKDPVTVSGREIAFSVPTYGPYTILFPKG